MLVFHVDPSWYERAWLTEYAPSGAARLGLHLRLVARRVASAMSAVAALHTLLLQQASARSPSLR